MSFFSQFDNIKESKGSGGGSYEKNPGWYLCKVNAVDISPDNHPGKPYILFKMTTDSNTLVSAKLWVATDTDKESTAHNKNKRVNEFFANLGIDLSSMSPEDALKEAVGKELNCAFQTREYIGKDKDTHKPEIKEILQYYFSRKIGVKYEPLNEDNSVSRLSAGDEAKFQQQLMMWEKQNKAKKQPAAKQAEVVEPNDDDELPF